MYRWDDRALISFHIEAELSVGGTADRDPHDSDAVGRLIDKRRAALAGDKQTCTLDQCCSRSLTIGAPGAGPIAVDAKYVTDDGVFVRGEELAEDPGLAERSIALMIEWQNEPPLWRC